MFYVLYHKDYSKESFVRHRISHINIINSQEYLWKHFFLCILINISCISVKGKNSTRERNAQYFKFQISNKKN